MQRVARRYQQRPVPVVVASAAVTAVVVLAGEA